VVLLRVVETESEALLLLPLFDYKSVPKAPNLSAEDTVLS
jgi:hypothetical protein